MRRGALALIATVLGTGLMVGAKAGHESLVDEAGAQAGPDGAADQGLAAGDGQAASSPVATAPSASVRSVIPTASGKPAASRTAGPISSAPPPSSAPSGPYRDGTYAGPSVRERYGTIKVTITVTGGRIATASASCGCSGESLSISRDAFKKLNPQVVTAQSANVQTVSGATYTSTAYKQSVAAAIDSAKA